MPGVTLHGYQTDGARPAILRAADLFICTSHDEGLGLPLLEAQYGGMPVVAPDAPVFREVLGASGIFISPSIPPLPRLILRAALSRPDWRANHVALAAQNLRRWNTLAESDRDAVIDLIAGLAGRPGPACRCARQPALTGHIFRHQPG